MDYTVLQQSNYLLNLQEVWSLLIFVLSKLVQLYLDFLSDNFIFSLKRQSIIIFPLCFNLLWKEVE